MRVLVTGAAGFIGSHLAQRLAGAGHAVCAVDALTPYYEPQRKRENLVGLPKGCEVVEADLRELDLREVLEGIEVVFHQAGQPGVRLSWESGFTEYASQNINVTQRLLEACRHARVDRFVYASSSSIYGESERYPTRETDLPRPHSPYGVTKLAAEHLCTLYADNWGLPTVSLRYFTVYGPRQRPDMAFHRLIEAALRGTPFPRYGDGSQVRDFTYVDDVVDANVAAAFADLPPGWTANVAGGSSASLVSVIRTVEEIAGRPVPVEALPAQPGDVTRTGGSTERIREHLGWTPRVGLREGIAAQLSWQAALEPHQLP